MIEFISGITFGIKYSKSFRVSDISGEIVDNILYNKKSPFKNLYKTIGTNGFLKILSDEQTGHQLQISQEDFILNLPITESFDKTISLLRDNLIPYIEKDLFTKFKVNNFTRIGIVYYHGISSLPNANLLVANFTENAIKECNNFELKFSKKIVPGNSALSNNNYINTIYNFIQSDEKFYVTLDYQLYFEPPIYNLAECNISQFIENSKKFLTESFHKWVNNYGEKK